MKKQRQRYTYIPNEEIAEITTFNDVTIEGKDLLDGAYAKGRRKYADGGMMKKPMSYYKYETPKVRIYWKGNIQPLGMFKSAEEAYEVIKKEFAEAKAFGFGGKMSDYEIHTPDAIIKLSDGMMAEGGMMRQGKLLEKVSEDWGRDSDFYSELEEAIISWSNSNGELTPKGKIAIKNILINYDSLEDYEQYLEDMHKYADGGMMADRPMSMEQQAAEAVGDEVWFSLEDREKSELVEELVKSGTITATGSSVDKRIMELIEQNDYFAEGGVATAGKFKVKYYLKESPNEIKEKFFDDKDRADFFFETIQEDEDIVVLPMETVVEKVVQKVEEKPKSKSLFSSAKPVPATATARKKMREQVQVNGIADEIARYDQLKATINNAKAEQELIGGRLKEIGRDKFLEIYEQRGFRPANFDLADGDENILLEVTDKYLKVEPEKAAMLEQYSGLLETKTTYEFNPDILEKEVSSGMTVGDVVSMLIQDSKLLSDADKENLIKAKTTMRVPKGTIDRLMDYDNPREVFNLISPILALK